MQTWKNSSLKGENGVDKYPKFTIPSLFDLPDHLIDQTQTKTLLGSAH